ncbi:MAG: hypothetical protein M3Z35_14095 [Nitrospirota bacterium]|nr:hypothetical protein [Nitrospirota bacterium]
MKTFSVLMALAMLIGFGTVTIMTYSDDPAGSHREGQGKDIDWSQGDERREKGREERRRPLVRIVSSRFVSHLTVTVEGLMLLSPEGSAHTAMPLHRNDFLL